MADVSEDVYHRSNVSQSSQAPQMMDASTTGSKDDKDGIALLDNGRKDKAIKDNAAEMACSKVEKHEDASSGQQPLSMSGDPEQVIVKVAPLLASLIDQRVEQRGSSYMDELLQKYGPASGSDTDDAAPEAIDEWIPKIGLDAQNKSVEIDVGSQVVVVNLADFYNLDDPSRSHNRPHLRASRCEDPQLDDDGALPAPTAAEDSSSAESKRVTSTKVRYRCCLCPAAAASPMTLRLHCATAHRLRPWPCQLCGLSFVAQRRLDRHVCEVREREKRQKKAADSLVRQKKRSDSWERQKKRSDSRERQQKTDDWEREQRAAAEAEPRRVPPVKIRPPPPPPPPPLQQRVRRLEDTSSSDSGGSDDSEPEAATVAPPPPARRPPPKQASPAGKRHSARKEAYVCRVCHSKFRDPKAVLHHLREYHPEHARKAWSKFQENLRSRESGPSSGEHARRKVPPMRLKLARVDPGSGSGSGTGRPRGRPPGRGRGRGAAAPADGAAGQAQRTDRSADEFRPSPPPSGPPTPGFVTCGVCGATKYYQHTAQCRQDGSYACQPCRRFARRCAADRALQCTAGDGRCRLPTVAPRGGGGADRCAACWLRRCLQAFNMPRARHDQLRGCLPASLRAAVPPAAEKPNRQAGHCQRDDVW